MCGAGAAGAAGVSSANENHLASCSGQMEPDGGSWEGALGSLEQRPHVLSSRPLPGPVSLQGVACNPASLPCPDSSGMQGPPTQATASPEDVTQNLER